jgi:hypothetical protein
MRAGFSPAGSDRDPRSGKNLVQSCGKMVGKSIALGDDVCHASL